MGASCCPGQRPRGGAAWRGVGRVCRANRSRRVVLPTCQSFQLLAPVQHLRLPREKEPQLWGRSPSSRDGRCSSPDSGRGAEPKRRQTLGGGWPAPEPLPLTQVRWRETSRHSSHGGEVKGTVWGELCERAAHGRPI